VKGNGMAGAFQNPALPDFATDDESRGKPSEKALSAGFANKAFRVEARGRQLNYFCQEYFVGMRRCGAV
jgi:hypothetical protein